MSPTIATKVMDYLTAQPDRAVKPELPDPLTDRERDVLTRVGVGESGVVVPGVDP